MADTKKIEHIKKGKPFSKLDLAAISISLAVCVTILVVMCSKRVAGAEVEITQAYENITQTFNLKTDREIVIDSREGQFIVEIKDGGVRVKKSPCRGQDCVYMGTIKYAGQRIICADTRIKISIKGSGDLIATT